MEKSGDIFSKDIYMMMLENSFDGFYITDGKANTIYMNKSYTSITGLQADEVLGRNMKDLVEEGTISQSGTLSVLRTGKAITLHQTFKTGRNALITSAPIRDEKGKIIMVVTNVRDMTEIYKLKTELDERNRERERLQDQLTLLKNDFLNQNLIAEDKKTLQVIAMLRKVRNMDTTVLLLGETGVGKEVFAKYLHRESRRRDRPFIKVNCGAIPSELMESEFFGYEKGAFTGAERSGKAGLFEVADKGTLFLDEIGELPLAMQVKLLRVLQEKEIMRVGSTKSVPVDVRIIAATNRELSEMVSRGTFREDLYYRLMVYPVRVPPLRERIGDISSLAENFVSELNQKYGQQKRFANLALDLMIAYRWPGNIRELKNVVERAFIICNEDVIYPENLSIFHSRDSYIFEDRQDKIQNLQDYLQRLEYEYIEAAYKKYGNVRDAAKSLGMSAPTFTRKKNRGSGL